MPEIFRMETADAHIIKTLFELLGSNSNNLNMCINKKGIEIKLINKNTSIFFNIMLNADNFSDYKCTKDKLLFTINLNQLNPELKPIKKKDTIILSIRDDNINKLIITHTPKEKTRITTKNINIIPSQSFDSDMLGDYDNYVSINGQEIQRIVKEINNVKVITIKTIGGKLIFEGSKNGGLVDVNIEYGKEEDDNNHEISQEFYTENFSKIIKLSGIGNIVKIHQKKNLPLFIKSNIGNSGYINVYIKTKDLQEEYERSTNE